MTKAATVTVLFSLILISSLSIHAQVRMKGTDLIIPFSNAVIDSSDWPNLAKEDLAKVEKVVCSNKNYEIMSFTIIIRIGTSVVETTSTSKFWAPKIVETMNQLNAGDKVWIEAITSKGPDRKVKMLRNVVFRIK